MIIKTISLPLCFWISFAELVMNTSFWTSSLVDAVMCLSKTQVLKLEGVYACLVKSFPLTPPFFPIADIPKVPINLIDSVKDWPHLWLLYISISSEIHFVPQAIHTLILFWHITILNKNLHFSKSLPHSCFSYYFSHQLTNIQICKWKMVAEWNGELLPW